MPILTRTLSWDQPLLPQVAGLLRQGCAGKPWDLSREFIVVPTRQAGRRLRERLAELAAEKDTGVLAPQLVTPDWFSSQLFGVNLPNVESSQALWAELFLEVDLEQHRSLFPMDPPRRDATWALGLARQIFKLQSSLKDHDLDFARVAEKTLGQDFEPERWQDLASLEARWREKLEERQLEDPLLAARSSVAELSVPEGVERVVVACVPDLLPLAQQALERWSETLNVEIWIHGDTEVPVHDHWGRAQKELLSQRPLPMPPSRCSLRLTKDAAETAQRIGALAGEYSRAPRSLTLGMVDACLAPATQQALAARGLSAHDPAGLPLANTAVGRLAAALALWNRNASKPSRCFCAILLWQGIWRGELKTVVPPRQSVLRRLIP